MINKIIAETNNRVCGGGGWWWNSDCPHKWPQEYITKQYYNIIIFSMGLLCNQNQQLPVKIARCSSTSKKSCCVSLLLLGFALNNWKIAIFFFFFIKEGLVKAHATLKVPHTSIIVECTVIQRVRTSLYLWPARAPSNKPSSFAIRTKREPSRQVQENSLFI